MATTLARCRLALLPVVLLFAASAAGDQLAWVTDDVAGRAAQVLQPGTQFVEWISHNRPAGDCGAPAVYTVRDVRIVRTHDHAELRVTARLIAVSEFLDPEKCIDLWSFSRVERQEERTMFLDLAYVYVPSKNAPSVFVNLAKMLGLRCAVRWSAIEVPADMPRAEVRPAFPPPDWF